MNTYSSHKFHVILLNTTKENIEEKLKPYLERLVKEIDFVNYGDVKIKTEIVVASEREIKIQMMLEK